MVSERVSGMENPIRDVVVRAEELEKAGKKIYYLNIGDPARFDFHPPKFVIEAAYAALKKPGHACYSASEGIRELREAIGKEDGVPPEQVIITNGVSEGINYSFACLIDPGENVLMPSPTYAPYLTMSRFMGGVDNFYHCEENWIPDVEEARKKINAKTRAILLVNPNNPTGTVYPRKVVKELVDLAGEYNLPVVSDEIYRGMEF
ncbi:MAG: aminotransferase class I/II-fold pyridoxal phosphate-dependent enzyme, partial [Candidatus Micrarchaeia archaeon]